MIQIENGTVPGHRMAEGDGGLDTSWGVVRPPSMVDTAMMIIASAS